MIKPEHLTLIVNPCYHWSDEFGNKEPKVMQWMIDEPGVYWTPNLVIHSKVYDGESIVDLERDISEMFDDRFNPVILNIPYNKWHIMKGKFKVTVQWSDNDD